MTDPREEWQIDTGVAIRTWRDPYFKEVSVELGLDMFAVDTEIGSGFMRESTSAHIPVRVIVRLLEDAGYVVTLPPSGDAKEDT